MRPPQGPIPAVVQGHFRHYAWSTYLLRLLMANLALMLVATATIWFMAYRLDSKPPLLVRAPKSLKQKAEAYYKMDEVTYDSVALFLSSTLPLLKAVDDGGYPLLGLTRGLVSGKIYEATRAGFERDLPRIRQNMIHQHLQVTRVMNVLTDEKSHRIAAYVKGYLVVAIQKGNTPPVFIPYRAQILLEQNPPSKLNSSPYFMIEKEERINSAALAWDREMEKEEAALSGGTKK